MCYGAGTLVKSPSGHEPCYWNINCHLHELVDVVCGLSYLPDTYLVYESLAAR
jgi:hypothetical protein